MEPPLSRYVVRCFIFALIGIIIGFSTDFFFTEIGTKFRLSNLERVVFQLLINMIVIYLFSVKLVYYVISYGETSYAKMFLTIMFFRSQVNFSSEMAKVFDAATIYLKAKY